MLTNEGKNIASLIEDKDSEELKNFCKIDVRKLQYLRILPKTYKGSL